MESQKTRQENQLLFDEVKEIADAYFYATERIRKKRRDCLKDADSDDDQYLKYVRKVTRAFQSLDFVEQTFINNEFFYQAYARWWEKLYSRTSFYRIRLRSMRHFKEAVNNAL